MLFNAALPSDKQAQLRIYNALYQFGMTENGKVFKEILGDLSRVAIKGLLNAKDPVDIGRAQGAAAVIGELITQIEKAGQNYKDTYQLIETKQQQNRKKTEGNQNGMV